MRSFFVSLILVLGMAWNPTEAAEPGFFDVMLAQAREISPEEAARRAKKKFGGKVLSSRLVDPGDQPPYYRVKLISKGTVRVVRIANRR